MNTNTTTNLLVQEHDHALTTRTPDLVDIVFTLKLPEGIKVEIVEGIPKAYTFMVINDFKKTYNLI